jgi:hypothetical protein
MIHITPRGRFYHPFHSHEKNKKASDFHKGIELASSRANMPSYIRLDIHININILEIDRYTHAYISIYMNIYI